MSSKSASASLPERPLSPAPSTKVGRIALMTFSFFLLIALMSVYAWRSGMPPSSCTICMTCSW
jgi:hypothetical protein